MIEIDLPLAYWCMFTLAAALMLWSSEREAFK